jgi:hypothetical protein
MNEKLYIVVVNWAGAPNTAIVEGALGALGTWLRFSNNVWFFKTQRETTDIFKALAAVLTKQDNEIIIRVDKNDWWGWAKQWVADWINK